MELPLYSSKNFLLSRYADVISKSVMMACLLMTLCLIPQAWTEDEETHGVLANGVVHNIAPDRKVEKIGGIMQPEPLDVYLKRLFDDLSKKLDMMDQRLQNIETSVNRNPVPPGLAENVGKQSIQKK